MESFNLLKFWRTSAVRDIDSDIDSVKKFVDAVDYISNPAPETDEEIDNDQDSFFDLVFTGISKENNNSKSVSERGSSLKQGKSESTSPESPRDVFFKPIDANSKPRSPNSMLKSAPKFRVCFLGFRKSKPEKLSMDDSSTVSPKIQTLKLSPKAESNRFTVKCKGEEEDSSINDSSQQYAKADMGKYLKLIKPLYSRTSKKYNTEKIRVSEKASTGNQFSPSVQPLSSSEEKQGNRVAVLQAVRKRLGKSRSTASSFAGVSTSPMNRRDDSLLEQNDGIQGAILHCKRSYSSARKDSEELNRWSI